MDDSKSIGLALFGIATYSFMYFRVVSKPHIIANNEEVRKIIDKCPTLNKIYWPTPYCWNAHLQLVPFILLGEWSKRFPKSKWHRQLVELKDGEKVALDWVVSAPNMAEDGLPCSQEDETPVLMLHHGAFGDSSDYSGREYVSHALKRGWFVCVLNRRGHAVPLTKGKWNFFGCVEDVHCATQSILQRRPKAKLFTIGFSAGTALVATIFGYDDTVNDFHAGVCVCPGFDITKCMRRFGFPYSNILLNLGKQFFLKANQHLLEDLPGYHECLNASDLQVWIDSSYAMAGCESKESYYKQYNPVNHVFKSKKPVISINSEDDPLCVVDNYTEQLHHIHNSGSTVGSILTKTGSHLTFYDGLFMSNWAERVAFEFLDAYLVLEKDKN